MSTSIAPICSRVAPASDSISSLILNWPSRAALRTTSALTLLDLRDNELHYPPSVRHQRACAQGKVLCEGFPPLSCQAFGGKYVVAADDPTKCIACGDRLYTILAIAGLSVVFILALATFGARRHIA